MFRSETTRLYRLEFYIYQFCLFDVLDVSSCFINQLRTFLRPQPVLMRPMFGSFGKAVGRGLGQWEARATESHKSSSLLSEPWTLHIRTMRGTVFWSYGGHFWRFTEVAKDAESWRMWQGSTCMSFVSKDAAQASCACSWTLWISRHITYLDSRHFLVQKRHCFLVRCRDLFSYFLSSMCCGSSEVTIAFVQWNFRPLIDHFDC